MIKKIIGIFLFLIFSLFPTNNFVHATMIAGQSASFKEKKTKPLNNDLFLKEMAISSILKKWHSPMIGNTNNFIRTCVKYDLDCYLLPAIAGVESGFGKHILASSYNPFGWNRGYKKFTGFSEAIQVVGYSLKTKYINQGAKNVTMIGHKYSASQTWPARVKYFTKEFSKEEQRLSLYSQNFPLEF